MEKLKSVKKLTSMQIFSAESISGVMIIFGPVLFSIFSAIARLVAEP